MFEIDKSFAHANISRTIRFTEPLFYELKALAEKENRVIFGGRLGEYKYYDMDKVIERALNLAEKELK